MHHFIFSFLNAGTYRQRVIIIVDEYIKVEQKKFLYPFYIFCLFSQLISIHFYCENVYIIISESLLVCKKFEILQRSALHNITFFF